MFWDKLPNQRIEGTFWEHAPPTYASLDTPQLEALFRAMQRRQQQGERAGKGQQGEQAGERGQEPVWAFPTAGSWAVSHCRTRVGSSAKGLPTLTPRRTHDRTQHSPPCPATGSAGANRGTASPSQQAEGGRGLAPKKSLACLDLKRATGIGIRMSRLRCPWRQLAQAVADADPAVLASAEDVAAVMQVGR